MGDHLTQRSSPRGTKQRAFALAAESSATQRL